MGRLLSGTNRKVMRWKYQDRHIWLPRRFLIFLSEEVLNERKKVDEPMNQGLVYIKGEEKLESKANLELSLAFFDVKAIMVKKSRSSPLAGW